MPVVGLHLIKAPDSSQAKIAQDVNRSNIVIRFIPCVMKSVYYICSLGQLSYEFFFITLLIFSSLI